MSVLHTTQTHVHMHERGKRRERKERKDRGEEERLTSEEEGERAAPAGGDRRG